MTTDERTIENDFKLATEWWNENRTATNLKLNQRRQYTNSTFINLPEDFQRKFERTANIVIDRVVANLDANPHFGGISLPSALIPVKNKVEPIVAKTSRLKTVWAGNDTEHQDVIDALIKEVTEFYAVQMGTSLVGVYIMLIPMCVVTEPTPVSTVTIDNCFGVLTRYGSYKLKGE